MPPLGVADFDFRFRARTRKTAGMYGEMRGILSTSVPPVPALELDAVAGRLEDVSADLVS
jgi:hypothetical protein